MLHTIWHFSAQKSVKVEKYNVGFGAFLPSEQSTVEKLDIFSMQIRVEAVSNGMSNIPSSRDKGIAAQVTVSKVQAVLRNSCFQFHLLLQHERGKANCSIWC